MKQLAVLKSMTSAKLLLNVGTHNNMLTNLHSCVDFITLKKLED